MSSPSSLPDPVYAGAAAPRRDAVADFPPIFAGRGRGRPRLRRVLPPRRRILAAGLALASAGATATAARTAPLDGPSGTSAPPHTARAKASGTGTEPRRPGTETVSAPVRIADAAAAGLVRPGDRVDVIATGTTDRGSGAGSAPPRVVARGVLVEQVPRSSGGGEPGLQDGALLVLEVSRRTATELAGAAAASRLAVALC